MLGPVITMNQGVLVEPNNLPVNSTKRSVEEVERATPCKKQRRHRVTWSDKCQVQIQEDLPKQFPDYDERDIWYSRSEYESFLVDRLRTVQCLRASGGDTKVLDPQFYSLRGLEPFQTADVHEEMHTKRRFHQNTILMEQARQAMLGRRNPECLRMMVEVQSEMSLRRAQELADLDELEVYGTVCRRQCAPINNATVPTVRLNPKDTSAPLSLSLSQKVRQLQEMNARRLIEIYSRPGGGAMPFRFQIRRDSLVGSHTGNNVGNMSELISQTNRFPIRRDSLTPAGAPTK